MKKFSVGLSCIILLAAFLCGCGGESAGSGTQDTEEAATTGSQPEGSGFWLPEGYVLSARFEDAGGEQAIGDTWLWLVGNKIYYYTNHYDWEQEVLSEDIYVQEKGTEARHLLGCGGEDGKKFLAMAAGEDESLYLLYGEGGKDENYQYGAYRMEKLDKEHRLVYSVAAGTKGISSIQGANMELGPDGMLYGMDIYGNVLCWDETGAFQGRFTLPKNRSDARWYKSHPCFGLVNAGALGIFAYWGGDEDNGKNPPSVYLYNLGEWRGMDEAEREKAEPLKVECAPGESQTGMYLYYVDLFSGYEEGVYLSDNNGLWQADLEDGSLTLLFAWDDIDVKAEYVKNVRRSEDGGFLLYIFDTLEKENYWVSLNPVPASEIPEKKELVLGLADNIYISDSLTSRFDQVVMCYNRTHPESHVTVVKYDKDSVTNFQLELLKGEGPDILLERDTFFNMETLYGKGAVENLLPYLEKSEDISTGDILPGILDLITKDGIAPRVPLSFSAEIMVLPEEEQLEIPTPQEMVTYMVQGGEALCDYMLYPKDFLYQILFGAEIDQYVDEENRSCSFDTEGFVSLLEGLAGLKNLEMVDEAERVEAFHSGQVRAFVAELGCMDDFLAVREIVRDYGRVTGFPNSSGELRYPARLYDWMGINSASEYKEEAWGFIEFCLEYTSRSDDMKDRFVVKKDKFAQQAQYAGGPCVLTPKYHRYIENWGEYQYIDATTQEETDLLWEISEHLYYYENNSLWQIIYEEASAFFAGDISAREAAKRIQNRASLVLGE